MKTKTISAKATLEVSSPAFKHQGYIPKKYTCEGENINPPLSIKKVPKGTLSLAIIMDDPDAQGGTFTHWLVWNITPPAVLIAENSCPGFNARNSIGECRYMGPCPPSGIHHYFFKVYALNTLLELDDDADKRVLEEALQGHVLSYGELIGLYEKHKNKS